MKSKKDRCDVCGKNSSVSDGWHLKAGKVYLNFCSYNCIASYIENTMVLMFKDLNSFEKRITALEKRFKK